VDIIDKFYLVCEYYDDDLLIVSLQIRKLGARGRPARILKNISNLNLDRYKTQIDILLQRIY
jgi:hypothetical protein